MTRKRSVRFSVAWPKKARFLNVEPNTAVPVGRVTLSPGVVHGISDVGVEAGTVLHTISSRRNERSE